MAEDLVFLADDVKTYTRTGSGKIGVDDRDIDGGLHVMNAPWIAGGAAVVESVIVFDVEENLENARLVLMSRATPRKPGFPVIVEQVTTPGHSAEVSGTEVARYNIPVGKEIVVDIGTLSPVDGKVMLRFTPGRVELEEGEPYLIAQHIFGVGENSLAPRSELIANVAEEVVAEEDDFQLFALSLALQLDLPFEKVVIILESMRAFFSANG